MIYNSAYNWGHLSLLDQTCFYCIAQIDAEWNSLTRGSTCLAIPALIFLGLAKGSFSGAAIVATPTTPALSSASRGSGTRWNPRRAA